MKMKKILRSASGVVAGLLLAACAASTEPESPGSSTNAELAGAGEGAWDPCFGGKPCPGQGTLPQQGSCGTPKGQPPRAGCDWSTTDCRWQCPICDPQLCSVGDH